MTEHVASGAAAPIEVYSLTEEDLRAAIQAGIDDFKAVPVFGVFFAAFYVAGGLALWFGLFASGQPAWFIAIAAGFPLFAPFAAVGLYEVSRRREAGEPLSWGPILSALKGRGDGQLALMAVGVLIAFGFWIILARGIFAIFLGTSGIGFESLGTLWTLPGIAMLLVGTAVGGLVALALFTVTVMSLPMLLDRDIDFVTAMITSVRAVSGNPQVMMKWAALIAGLLFAAMVPLFLGLVVVLPILGHATWHLYRRAVAR
jgi:uncharacterized membrane protein